MVNRASRHEVTRLLRELTKGDRSAMDLLMPIVYEELRARAAKFLQREPPGHTLQPTALVNETYLALVRQEHVVWNDRSHFYAVAATCIRRILIDHARRRKAARRGGSKTMVSLEESEPAVWRNPEEFLSLNEALERLASLDARKARVMELRFFAGLRNHEIATAMSVSTPTVERDLNLARAWLYRELQQEAE